MQEMDADHKSALDFNTLLPYQPRVFVPQASDLTHKETVATLFQQLLARDLSTDAELEALMGDRSELEAAVAQVNSILYIRMTCQTDDAQRAKAYKDFIETVVPATKPLADQLDRKIIDAVDRLDFDNSRYDVYFRKLRCDIELFRAENVSLQTEDALLSQQYQAITGAMTVNFDGKEYPISQMRKFLAKTDRQQRRRAWQATNERYLKDAKKLDEIFDKMISVRTQIAQNAGFKNYRDYKFREYHRFDYTPDDCKQYHRAIETHLVSVQQKIMSLRAGQLDLDKLSPWDLVVDPLGRSPLKPFQSISQFIDGLGKMFAQLDGEFGDYFNVLVDNGLLDLDSRKGKAPGGYQSTLYEARKPFIFMNAIGTNDDLRVLMHEGGHAFHALSCAHDPLLDYRHAPMEFCEVASMSMEFLAASQLSVCYDESQQGRWWRNQLETVVRILISVAVNDAFQHWIYENPTHSRTQRNEKWIELNDRFGSDRVDWTGFEKERASQWHAILHLFQVPFYYIEYGIAQLGALGLWQQSKEDMAVAISNYKKALSLGGSQPLPQLFAAADLKFDFSEKTIQPLAQTVLTQWEQLTDIQ